MNEVSLIVPINPINPNMDVPITKRHSVLSLSYIRSVICISACPSGKQNLNQMKKERKRFVLNNIERHWLNTEDCFARNKYSHTCPLTQNLYLIGNESFSFRHRRHGKKYMELLLPKEALHEWMATLCLRQCNIPQYLSTSDGAKKVKDWCETSCQMYKVGQILDIGLKPAGQTLEDPEIGIFHFYVGGQKCATVGRRWLFNRTNCNVFCNQSDRIKAQQEIIREECEAWNDNMC